MHVPRTWSLDLRTHEVNTQWAEIPEYAPNDDNFRVIFRSGSERRCKLRQYADALEPGVGGWVHDDGDNVTLNAGNYQCSNHRQSAISFSHLISLALFFRTTLLCCIVSILRSALFDADSWLQTHA
ncbi:hypothetical protein BD410DRAFT_796482 [Rickenella mellea]|uniref:Uncharacterized protein n=1 Tax=Rickenella mellea TaxID=50990 RepID=A0A4Y7PJ04_9AGAM|nr:hypothetical protein BD410DRAFT_796482 [Rickenella mellea]